jgi:PAS domain S-box-containing protein
MLGVAYGTHLVKEPTVVSRALFVYLLFVGLLAIAPDVLEQKRLRAIPIVLDILAISILVWADGGTESPLFLFYVFPVLSAARYLGRTGTMALAVFAAACYSLVSLHPPGTFAFWLRLLVLMGLAGTAANLARIKHRTDEDLVRAIAQIDGMILRDTDVKLVMATILKTAMDVSGSDASAMILADQAAEPFALSRIRADKDAATRIVRENYPRVVETKRPVSLSERPLIAAMKASLSRNNPAQWTGRIIPIETGGTLLGVMGVFSRRSFHYTTNDEERLRLMTPLVAIAHKNATLYPRLAASERYFKKLVYNSPDPIIVLDGQGRVQNFNLECSKIWGYTEQQVFQHPEVARYYESEEHAREIGRALKEALDHTIKDYPARIRDARGQVIPIRLSASLFYDQQNKITGSIGVFKDERRIHAAQLAAFGQLAQKMIHDIKTQISVIQNYVNALEPMSRNDSSLRTAWTGIRQATVTALSKLQNILMTAKPRTPEKTVISICSLLDAFEGSIREWAAAASVEYRATYPGADVNVLADGEEINQVLTNLFANSVDAIAAVQPPRLGRIELNVSQEQGHVRLLWRDNGVGMEPDVLSNAFMPFYTTKTAGSGLGLYHTKMIVENHDGRIDVGRAEDHGVEFTITLPYYTPIAPEETGS